ncbi:RNA-binding protein [Candidatus Woesearchaeota archaeon]|nr:MAG: RNA-binding protein [Candidatus Woesearchaeota archaeon]
MDKQLLKQLKQKVKLLPAVTRIGKNGLTDAVVKEIIKQLNKKKLVKVKLLKAAFVQTDKKDLVEDILKKTKAVLVDVTGSNVTITKREKKTTSYFKAHMVLINSKKKTKRI